LSQIKTLFLVFGKHPNMGKAFIFWKPFQKRNWFTSSSNLSRNEI